MKVVLWIVVIVVVVLGIYALVSQGPSQTATPIKIGFIEPLTGDVASIGVANRAAVEVAVDEVNAAGGINGRKLEVIYEDGQCNAQAAVSAASKLMNIDGVTVILGGLCSTETAALGPTAMQNRVIVFSPGSSAPKLSQLGKYFFRSYPSDSFQGKFAAEYAYNTLEARNVAVVYHVSDWGTGIKDVFVQRFTELGGKIVAEEGAAQEIRDYRSVLTKVKATNPNLVYMPTYPDGGIVAIKQASELGIKVKLFGGDAWDDPKLWKEAAGKADVVFTVPFSPVSDEFKAKIKAKIGRDDIQIGTPNAYDNVKIIAATMARVGTDTDAIQNALHNLKDYPGVSGTISFDQNGDITSAQYVVKKVNSDGAVEVVYPAPSQQP